MTVPIPQTDAPRVVTVQDVQHHELPAMFSTAERRYRRWAYDGAARDADVVVVPSRHSSRSLQRHVGIQPDRIAVAPYGVDHDRFGPDGAPAPAVDSLDLPERFVIYPGNLWPHKNHERLVEAMALTEDRDIALVLTGQPSPRLEPLTALAARRGVGHRIQHVGYVCAAAVPELYRRAVGMVFPSLYEGFGFPVLEAMACGCAVASSTEGSLAEIVDARVAVLLDPRDPHDIARAIDRLAGDQGLRVRLAGVGLAQAARFTWRACAEAHVDAYGRAAATRERL
jgi:glycosyltransferase involved in cell wall biosynthesis